MKYTPSNKFALSVAALLCLSLCLLTVEARAESIVEMIIAEADSALWETSPDYVWDGGPKLYARTQRSSSAKHEFSIVRFSLASLAGMDAEAIQGITLNLTSMKNDGTKPVEFYGLYEADSLVDGLPWDETTMSSRKCPGYFLDTSLPNVEYAAGGTTMQILDMVAPDDPGDDSTAIATPLGSWSPNLVSNTTATFSSDALTAFLTAAIANGDESVSIVLHGGPQSTAALVSFFSKDALVTEIAGNGYAVGASIPESFKPYLEVTSAAVPEPSSMILLAVMAVAFGVFWRRK